MSGNTFKMKHTDVDLYGPRCRLSVQQRVAAERRQCGQAKIDPA